MFVCERIYSKVAFHIFTNGTKTLGLNLTQRFKITDEGENVTENVGDEKKTESFKRTDDVEKQ